MDAWPRSGLGKSEMEPTATRVDVYAGAYGRTVRIDVWAEGDLRLLVVAFRDLGSGPTTRTYLKDVLAYEDVQSYEVVLGVIDVPKWRPEVQVSQSDLGGYIVHFSQSRSDWQDAADMVAALVGPDPGHQYLAEGDVIVEVAYREPSAERGLGCAGGPS